MFFSPDRDQDSTAHADDPYEPTTHAEAALAMSVTSCAVVDVISLPSVWLRGTVVLASASAASKRSQRLGYLRRVLARADTSERGSAVDQERIDAEAMEDLAPYRAEATLVAHQQADES